jgi:hypothetical protein
MWSWILAALALPIEQAKYPPLQKARSFQKLYRRYGRLPTVRHGLKVDGYGIEGSRVTIGKSDAASVKRQETETSARFTLSSSPEGNEAEPAPHLEAVRSIVFVVFL